MRAIILMLGLVACTDDDSPRRRGGGHTTQTQTPPPAVTDELDDAELELDELEEAP